MTWAFYRGLSLGLYSDFRLLRITPFGIGREEAKKVNTKRRNYFFGAMDLTAQRTELPLICFFAQNTGEDMTPFRPRQQNPDQHQSDHQMVK